MAWLHQVLTSTKAQKSRSQVIFWLSLSLSFAVIYSIPALQQAFSGEYIVQDDARQHIFWMQRFVDPKLFPNDVIADYFQSVAPWGYTTLYKTMAALGIHPFLLHKVLPIVLAAIATAYGFGVCLQLFPIPVAAFITTLLLNQNLWMQDDLVSGTPVAFVYPLFLAFLYYLLRGSLLGVGVAIALLGLFYPQCMLVALAILSLRLWDWTGKFLSRSTHRSDYLLFLCGVGVVSAILWSYTLKSSEFGPTLSMAEARSLPAFSEKGWSSFFSDSFSKFWLCGKRSGMIPAEWCVLTDRWFPLPIPPQIFAGFSLPLLFKFSSRFPLTQAVTPKAIVLPQIAIASLTMFFLAHTVVFKLHLPNRYTEHTARILMAILAGIALTIAIDAVFHWAEVKRQQATGKFPWKKLPSICWGILGAGLFSYPQLLPLSQFPFPATNYTVGRVPSIYQFFEAQPKDITIASLAAEANNLPSFAKRSILAGGEGYALPYHPQFYREIRQRTIALIQAQYQTDLEAVKQFIQKYKVDFWMLDRDAFTLEYVSRDRWLKQYQPFGSEVVDRLKAGNIPALAKVRDRCTVLEEQNLVVLSANCLVQESVNRN